MANKELNIKFADNKLKISLNKNDLFITIINISNNKVYEKKTDIRDVDCVLGKEYIFNTIIECFKKTPNYFLKINLKNNIIYLEFEHNYLNIHTSFNINLEEIIDTNKLLTDNYDKIKKLNDSNENEINDLKTVINNLKSSYELQISNLKLSHQTEMNNLKSMYELQISNVKSIYESEINNLKTFFETEVDSLVLLHESEINLKYILDSVSNIEIKLTKEETNKNVYIPLNSKKISLSNINEEDKIKIFMNLEELEIHTNKDTINFENINLKYLKLYAPNITTLNGLDKFPNLVTLELINCNNLYDIKKYIHKNIKNIIFTKCGINQKRNMISFCNALNIDLVYN